LLAPATPAEPERLAVGRDGAIAPVADDLVGVEDAFTVTGDPLEAPADTDGDAFTETVGLDTVVVAFTGAVGAFAVTVGTVTVGALTGTVGALTGGGGALSGTEAVGVVRGTGGVCTVTVGVVTGTETVSEGKLSAAAGDAPASTASGPAASTPQMAIILIFGACDMRAIPNSERLSVSCGSTFVQ
jgi:hypothetical protein